MAVPFSRFLRLVELATHEQEAQYRLHMEGHAFHSWLYYSSQTEKAKPYEKWQEMLNLKKPEFIDLEKEKAEALKNLEWMRKPMLFAEKKVELPQITTYKKGPQTKPRIKPKS